MDLKEQVPFLLHLHKNIYFIHNYPSSYFIFILIFCLLTFSREVNFFPTFRNYGISGRLFRDRSSTP